MVYWLGNQIVQWAKIPVPGTVVGMILLFVLLSAGIVKLEYVQVATDFLLKHMLFFFVPIAVGLMNWGGLFWNNGLILAAAIVFSALVPFFAVGHLGQKLSRSKKV
ncbi:holin-like protein CidA [Sporomusaceae bacterium FL31]|nr:holin-like protein CidA [Sporomusaceae bacterium FL31]GCE32965.1 holin-like protein CidA [Sporomusaceae bacterium]